MGEKLTTRIGLTASLTLLCSTAAASGFRIPEISTVGIGTSNALIANTDEVGAMPYNPAAMAFHEGATLNAGITRITYEPRVTPAVGTANDSSGEDTFLIPNLYFKAAGDNGRTFGLAINAPFGLETKWPVGTFGSFPAQDFAPELSRIKMLNINPNMAWKIDDTSSFAFGIDLYDLDELMFNTNGATIKGNGSGLGWNIGYQKKFNKLNLGVSYRSAVKVDAAGVLHAYSAAYGSNPPIAASATLEFPDMLQAGIYYQVTNSLGIELDVERTGWSSFDKLSVLDSTGTEQVSSTNNWKDTTAYRLGAIYQVTPKTKLLFGYSKDDSPQPDEYFSARVPDNNRQLYSIGVTHDYGSWTLEAAYMLVDVDDRTVNSSTAVNPADPNGTLAYNGKYETKSTLLGISASLKF